MPEQIPSPDLDRAFDDLVRDVDTVTHRRGADAAMRTARRRRTTAVAGGAAAAVLVAGGLGWALLPDGGRGDDAPVATEPDLPAAAPFEAADLEAAYGRSWREGSSPVLTDPVCVRGLGADPAGYATQEFLAPSAGGVQLSAGAAYTYARFDDTRTTSLVAERLTEAMSQCREAPAGEQVLDVGPDASAYVASYPALGPEPSRDQYVVQSGDRLVLLTVVRGRPGSPGPLQIGTEAATALSTAVLAGLLSETD